MPSTIMMFCGQGAQYYQMGRALYDRDPVFRQEMDRCDRIVAAMGGTPVSQVIYGRSLSETDGFDRLTETNPALLAISHALATTMMAQGVRPDRLLGYSLGETIAAVAGGVLSLEDGFRLVLGQARLFEQYAPPGTMIAVLADPVRVAGSAALMAFCDMAAINTPSHCVLSLLARDIPAVTAELDRMGVTWARLPVRYPFHAAAIEPLARPMQDLTSTFRFAPSRWPIVSATTGGIVPRFDGAHIWRVMRNALRFRETIEALARQDAWTLVEAGPSGTLASFTRQMRLPALTAWASIDQFGQNDRTMRQLVAAAT
ncbi:MAG: acyltransferase domain-containing protein [Acetobacteraceae bacterium]